MTDFPVMISVNCEPQLDSVAFPGAVDGEPVTFALDTRTSGITIGAADAARLGLAEGATPTVSVSLLAWDEVPVAIGASDGSMIGLPFLLANTDQVAVQIPTGQFTLYHAGDKPGRILP